MTSNMIYIAAFGVGLKFPRKIHLNTHGGLPHLPPRFRQSWLAWDNDDPAEIPNNVKQVDILPQMTSLCNNNFLPNPKLETYCF